MKPKLEEVMKELTELKLKYKAIEEELENYRANSDSVNTLIFDTYFVSPTEIFVKHPAFFACLLGYDKDEFNDFDFEKFFSRIHDEDKDDYKRMMNMFISKERKMISGHFRMKHKSGDYYWFFGMVKLKGYDTMTGKPVISGFVHMIMSESLLDEKLNTLLKEFKMRKAERLPHKFSKHDLDICQYIADGHKSYEICKKYNICNSTLKAIKKEMFEKAGVKNSPELVKFLYSYGLL